MYWPSEVLCQLGTMQSFVFLLPEADAYKQEYRNIVGDRHKMMAKSLRNDEMFDSRFS